VQLFRLDRHVEMDFNFDEIALPLEVSVPLGLIVAELVTNSLRHAASEAGFRLSVSMTREDHGTIRLVVQDTGPGFPSESDSPSTLGLRLVEGLARQLRAGVDFANNPGATVTLRFSLLE
jgi:two-component sensor histidine kinase